MQCEEALGMFWDQLGNYFSYIEALNLHSINFHCNLSAGGCLFVNQLISGVE